MLINKPWTVLCGLMMVSCTGDSEQSEEQKTTALVVYSFSFPVGHLVDRLVGDAVQHECILPAGEMVSQHQYPLVPFWSSGDWADQIYRYLLPRPASI